MEDLRFRLYRDDDHDALQHWLAERRPATFPPAPALIPKSSSFVAADEHDRPVALAIFYVCGDAPVAMLSWLFTDPGIGMFRAHAAAELAIRGGLYCLDRQKICMILSRLSTRGSAKMLAREGFEPVQEVKTEMGRIKTYETI